MIAAMQSGRLPHRGARARDADRAGAGPRSRRHYPRLEPTNCSRCSPRRGWPIRCRSRATSHGFARCLVETQQAHRGLLGRAENRHQLRTVNGGAGRIRARALRQRGGAAPAAALRATGTVVMDKAQQVYHRSAGSPLAIPTWPLTSAAHAVRRLGRACTWARTARSNGRPARSAGCRCRTTPLLGARRPAQRLSLH